MICCLAKVAGNPAGLSGRAGALPCFSDGGGGGQGFSRNRTSLLSWSCKEQADDQLRRGLGSEAM